MVNKKKNSQQLENLVSELTNMVKDTSLGRKDHTKPEELKERFDLLLLDRVYKTFLKKGNEKTFLKALEIPHKRWEKILALIKHFKNLIHPSSGDPKDYEARFQYFVNNFGEFVDLKVCRPGRQNISYLYVRFLNPPLDCLKGELLFFPTKGEIPLQEIQQFVNIIESLPQEYLRKVAFILAPAGEEEFSRLVQESRYRFVVLSSIDLKEIILAGSPQVELNGVITRQLDLLDIQPYRTHGSTPSTMFFGRKREMDQMLNSPTMSVAIYGGRQLGKTSLLRKLQQVLGEEMGETTVFITCEGIQNNLDLGLEILKQLGIDIKNIRSIPEFEEKFRDYLRKQRGHFTIIIDEVDDLVDLDRKSSPKIFVALRNIKNDFEGKCRFFFAGFKKLYSEFYRLYAPFRNFAEPCELKSLSKREARKLIEEPLCNRLGIQFQRRKKITEKIFEYTGGHPCFIQHYCKCLIERIAQDNRRFITEEDVEHVYQSEAYRNLIIGNYSDNFREGEERGDIVPKLLICHIIFEEMESFTENKLLSSLKKSQVFMEPFRLRTELRKLTMTSVLERTGNVYRFTNSVYPRILKESENLADILIQLMEEYEVYREQESRVQPAKETLLDQFILRDSILNQVVADSEKSYAIVGGTGFGKTSLLKSLKELYEFDLSYRPLYCSASNLESAGNLLEELLMLVGMGKSNPRDCLDMLKEFIADENQHGRRQAFLIDDLDNLIRQDSKGLGELLKEFEQISIALGEGFRAILSGGSLLYTLVSQKPFPKSMEVIHLKPLDDRDARALLFHIFKAKGNFKLGDETLIDLILEVTGGNPTLIEKFAFLLSQRVEKALVQEENLEEIIEDENFQNFLLRVYESGWNSEQEGIVETLMEEEKERFTISEIAKKSDVEEKKLRDEFSRFSLLGFLKRAGRYYRFSNPYYKDCYYRRKGK